MGRIWGLPLHTGEWNAGGPFVCPTEKTCRNTTFLEEGLGHRQCGSFVGQLPASSKRDDDFGLDLLVENPGGIEA